MGQDNNERRNGTRSRTPRRNPRNFANWLDADGAILKRAISAASTVGGALRFGYSRDGGAFAVGVYGDGEPYTDFYSPTEDINEFLEDYVKLFEGIQDDMEKPAPAPKSPTAPKKGS